MVNFSDRTRKDQVHNYLKIRLNQWVDGTALANEQVGGSEGLKRLRELRKELEDSRFEIEMRGHPDPSRSIFQYRMTERSLEPRAYTEPAPASPMQVASVPPPNVRPPTRQNAPATRRSFTSERGHLVYDEETATYLAVVDGEPAPILQPSMGVPTDDGLKYSVMPSKLDFGKSRPCPKCHGIHRSKKGTDGLVIKGQYEKMTRNPAKPSEDCPRCNGFGLIPA